MVLENIKQDAGALKPNEEHLDPNEAQRAASNPLESIWVGASAGTGKTKVLTDRVLRLLLPRDDGRQGTPPNRILCLTFTKAAANEMAVRINKTLSHWAVMDLDNPDHKKSLTHVLTDLLGKPPSKEQIVAAQRLFADVIDCPGGLQIMTIHSFCQSVLGRFPLEADLPPNFTLLDDIMAADMMKQAQNAVLNLAGKDEQASSPLSLAVNALASEIDEASFSKIISGICGERHQLLKLLSRYKSADGVYADICEYYGINQFSSDDDIEAAFCREGTYDASALRQAAQAMMQDKGKKPPVYGANILQWIDAAFEERVNSFDLYRSCFLTTKGEVRTQAFPPKSAINIYPACKEVLHAEAQRLIDANEIIKRAKSAQLTKDLIVVGYEVVRHYTRIKHEQGMLDFDDLILRTMDLLHGNTSSLSSLSSENTAPWIMYKLDQGLDHILVDEAQDTNPEQWRIVEAICEEFFSGKTARSDILRTSFTVGDIKQSIYSFQRAAPEEFQKMQSVFDEKINAAGLVNRNVGLDISFRSTESVLRVVDNVFKDPKLNHSVGGGDITHKSFRAGQAGLVEIWPLIEKVEYEKSDYWTPPTEIKNTQSGYSALAEQVATNIKVWLDSKEILPSHNRPIEAGDIMILVRSRSSFVDQMVRALKSVKIPVSGADRMVLSEQLAVQDLLAMASFCLLPDDDLTLAEILKSPLLGWDEDELFSLSYNRKGTLWQEICNFDHNKIDAITGHDEPIKCVNDEKRLIAHDYLSRLIGRARYLGSYEFFSYILNMPCPADKISGLRAITGRLGADALDPIDELLNSALNFTYDNIDHLQVFLDQQTHKNMQIKREMDESMGQVRIMTIHGSKGLQSPIVIMPDTVKTSAAKKMGRMLWGNKTGLDMPLFSARKDSDPKIYSDIYQSCRDLEEEEYYRLLYVAMTRAEDRLYIAGYNAGRGVDENSWYFKVHSAIKNDSNCIELENGNLRIENPQTKDPDRKEKVKDIASIDSKIPKWMYSPAPDEPFPPRPLVPSRPSVGGEETATSPLVAMDNKRFRRGNVTHKLLQFLPDFEESKRRDAALKFVQKNASDLSENVCKSIVSEVMNIIENPEFAPFFVQGSMAEVSVTGLMSDNRIVSGQIDRLVVGKEEIWILDYKTNRPPPHDPKDVPPIYHKQMAAYKDSIREIYPKHKINCALLWTDGPFLTIL